jgi:hypothetical protein
VSNQLPPPLGCSLRAGEPGATPLCVGYDGERTTAGRVPMSDDVPSACRRGDMPTSPSTEICPKTGGIALADTGHAETPNVSKKANENEELTARQGRSRFHATPDNCALMPIDHQPFQATAVRNNDPALMINKVVALAKSPWELQLLERRARAGA